MAASEIRSASSACRAVSVGGEVEVDQRAHHAAVGLLGEGRAEVAGAEAGLDVADGDATVEAGQGGAEDCRGVTLHEDDVGLEPG